MEIKHRLYNGTLYIVFDGELDECSAGFVRDYIDSRFTEGKFNQVVMDLSNLTFMDSTGVGVMIGRYKKLKERGVPIFISSPSIQADKIFKMTGMYDIMPKIN